MLERVFHDLKTFFDVERVFKSIDKPIWMVARQVQSSIQETRFQASASYVFRLQLFSDS